MTDPVSWLVVERGWRVVGPDGEDLGQVEDVRGETETDIFNGLAVRQGTFGQVRELPAEHVTEIEEGVVHVDLRDLDALAPPR
jgi:sporulation protein YlmC with PRC-barrel domain